MTRLKQRDQQRAKCPQYCTRKQAGARSLGFVQVCSRAQGNKEGCGPGSARREHPWRSGKAFVAVSAGRRHPVTAWKESINHLLAAPSLTNFHVHGTLSTSLSPRHETSTMDGIVGWRFGRTRLVSKPPIQRPSNAPTTSDPRWISGRNTATTSHWLRNGERFWPSLQLACLSAGGGL
jgi:hypothetical protein